MPRPEARVRQTLSRALAWLALLLTLCAGALTARAQDANAPEQRFERAAQAMAAGAHGDAAEQLVQLAEDHPEHALAAEALFSAARLSEENLADPGRALALYRALVERYPDSRTALAATRRADALAAQIGPGGDGGDALARFTEILNDYDAADEAPSLAAAEALLAAHADWVGSPRVLLWLAEVHRRAGRHRDASARYLEVAERWPEGEHALRAWRGAGDMAVRLGEFRRAQELYRHMQPQGPAEQRSLDEALRSLDIERLRTRLFALCCAALAAVFLGLLASLLHAAGGLRPGLRALRTPPTEALFMIPIAALLTAASFTGHASIGPAVALLCGVGAALSWLSGAGLDAARRRALPNRARPLVHAAAAVIAVLALSYIALHRGHLVDMILETVRFGPEV